MKQKLIRNGELNNKTINVGSTFYRERTMCYRPNVYYFCKVIEKNGANITFEQYDLNGNQLATRTAKIMNGRIAFEYSNNTGFDYSSINNKLELKGNYFDF